MRLIQLKISLFAFVFVLLFSSNTLAQSEEDTSHIEVSLRMIGHQVLLNSKDSISRVLPIIKENDRYKIVFESEFEFKPEELVATFNRIIKETGIAKSYIVEVEACETSEVVYIFEIGYAEKSNIIPCFGRDIPKSCYSILFTLMDPLSLVDLSGGSSVDSSNEVGLAAYSAVSVLFMFLVGFIIFLWQKRIKAASDPNLISLGAYQFDKRNTELIFRNQKTELTSKEADLLLLLHNQVNMGVEREVILNAVWGDEGGYVGRTLDVFISKLRKKLEGDSSVKIVNIRGVGYKLVLNN
ncbi:MAG: hypothetical protein ACI83B_000806 [Sediminicola sp.]|jgi:hypothetical protein|tara:strand:- start:555 stop:1445 length:891 start_codon:yes stop_codon:yes gene_type:complete